MRVVILSRSRALYSTRRLVEACKREGLSPQVLDPLELFLLVGDGGAKLFHREGKRQPGRIDLAIPRIGSTITDYGLMVIQQLETMGVPVLNGARATALSRDKLRCLQLLSSHGLSIPRTTVLRHPAQLSLALAEVGGPPAVLKVVQGSQGIGVMLLETAESIRSVLDSLWSLGQIILLQEFVEESRGRDIRVLVVGGKVLIAMRRQARAGEFRSNIHRGGSGSVVQLDESYSRAAVKAAEVLGLPVAGVDLLEGADGPKVLEVNPSPGFEGLEAASDLDVAGAIVRQGLRLLPQLQQGTAS